MQTASIPATSLFSRLSRCRAPVALLASPRAGGATGRSSAPASSAAPPRCCGLLPAVRDHAAPCRVPPSGHKRRHTGSAAAAGDSAASAGGGGGEGRDGSWPPPPPPPPPLEEWLLSHGGTVNGVELRSVLHPSGATDRQLRATRDHPAGEVLVSVPRMMQIRYDNIEEAATAAAVVTTSDAPGRPPSSGGGGDIGGDTGCALAIPPADAAILTALYAMMPTGSDTGASAWPFKQALTLLYHLSRGSASPMLPYLAHLPGLAPGVPTPRVGMLMYDDAANELQYPFIVQDIMNQKYWLRRVANEVLGREASSLVATAFGGLAVDEELFAWAAAVAMSRCFGLTRFRTHTCVPLVDMANHVAPYSASNCEIRTGPDGEVVMYGKRQIRAGEELTLTYGPHDNHNLLLSYGFTLQPNPNDAFYFDMDISTVESLVVEDPAGENAAGGSGGPLAPWQLELLESKLGLRRREEGAGEAGSGGGNGNGVIRVYFSAAAPAAVGADGGGGAGAAGRMEVRQPVDPRLLAALRIATLQDKAWFRILSGQSTDQIGAWNNLLARQQEITILRLLVSLVTALYTTFPTTIQQDRQLLASASLDVAASAAAAILSPLAKSDAGSGASADDAGGVRATDGGGSGVLRPSGPGAGAGASRADPAAAATADHARDMAEAVRFRLGLKTTLEGCLKALVARARELDQLQKVR